MATQFMSETRISLITDMFSAGGMKGEKKECCHIVSSEIRVHEAGAPPTAIPRCLREVNDRDSLLWIKTASECTELVMKGSQPTSYHIESELPGFVVNVCMPHMPSHETVDSPSAETHPSR